jgi:hypothetical protein
MQAQRAPWVADSPSVECGPTNRRKAGVSVARPLMRREIGVGVKEGGLIDGLVERILCIYGPCGPNADGSKQQGFFDRMKTSAMNAVLSSGGCIVNQ